MLGSTEIIVLVVVIGVLIFGAKKIPELAKTFGKAKGEFEKGKIEAGCSRSRRANASRPGLPHR